LLRAFRGVRIFLLLEIQQDDLKNDLGMSQHSPVATMLAVARHVTITSATEAAPFSGPPIHRLVLGECEALLRTHVTNLFNRAHRQTGDTADLTRDQMAFTTRWGGSDTTSGIATPHWERG